jgi:methyltransferase
MKPAILLLVFVTAERLGELWLARRNTTALLSRGAYEVAPGHYPLIVLLHASWLVGLWVFGRTNPLDPYWFSLFMVLQALRFWVLATLGGRWTTRILVLPGASLVTSGPYRLMAHPNYLVVVGEVAILPLCLDLPWFALVFSVANAAILAIRIRAENEALGRLRDTPDEINRIPRRL